MSRAARSTAPRTDFEGRNELRQRNDEEVQVAELVELLDQHHGQERQGAVLLVSNHVAWEALCRHLSIVAQERVSVRETDCVRDGSGEVCGIPRALQAEWYGLGARGGTSHNRRSDSRLSAAAQCR